MGLRVQVDVHPDSGRVVVTASGQADPAAAGSLAAVVDVLAREPVRSVVLDLDRADTPPPALDALVEAIDERGIADRVSLTLHGHQPGLRRGRRHLPDVSFAHELADAQPVPAS